MSPMIASAERSAAPARSDPVTLEIVKNALASIADEMALVILRSAYSPIVRDSMDYSTAVCDASGRIIAQGLTNPVHLGSFPSVMTHVLERFGGSMRPGDSFITNDPYGAGGMHLPDVYLIRPVFHEDRVEGFAATLVHHTDLGGMAPGSMALHATELFQEGLRIPLLKAFVDGRPVDAVTAFLEANSRVPEQVLGDFRAQVAGCAAGERGLSDLFLRYGADAMRAMLAELHDYAEALTRDAIRAMPDGRYDAVDFIDGLGEGGPIRFQVRVTVSGDALDIDWTGTSDQVPGAINGPVAITHSVAYAAARCAVGRSIPNFEGYTRPITVTAPLGSIVNPRFPAACAARGVMAYRMLDVLFAAFAQIVPNRIPAAGEGGPSAISLSGRHDGTPWLVTDGILGSWGGRASKDGLEGISNPAGNLSNMPVELLEAGHPLRVEEYGFALNSGGAGEHRGGMAITRAYRVLGEAASLTVRSDRRQHPPPALAGGVAGSPSLNILSSGGRITLLPVMPMHTVKLDRGDVFVHLAPGGAGHGDPLRRDGARVAADVADGRITVDLAREVYGVVLDAEGRADAAATASLRERLAADPDLIARAQRQAFYACDPLRRVVAAEAEGAARSRGLATDSLNTERAIGSK